jgi:two-component system cell cycle response regulator
MNDGRLRAAWALGGGGLAVSVLGVIVDTPVLGIVAGAAALGVAGMTAAIAANHETDKARHAKLATDVTDLEQALTAQVQARMNAEEAVRSLGEQLAQAQRGGDRQPTIDISVNRSGEAGLTDPLTGLFSEDYFRVAVDARIAAARRHLRPVAVVLLEVIEGLRSDRPQAASPVLVAETVVATLREADTACRMADGRISLVLEDTSENGAIWTVERLRRNLAEAQQGLTLRAGIACYPAHAFSAAELLRRGEDALVSARDWQQDRIEVAPVE